MATNEEKSQGFN